MKALILSCEAGGGYTDLSMAVKEKLEDHGHEVTLFDRRSLRNGTSGGFFRRKVGLGSDSQNESVMRQYLEQNPFDVIIAMDMLSAVLVSVLRSSPVSFPKVIYVASDYTCAPFIEDTLCDYYVIPSQKLTAEFCRRGIPREKVVSIGVPVKKEFLTGISKEEAAIAVGLSAEEYHILLLAGGLGRRKVFWTMNVLKTYLDRNPKARLIISEIRNESIYRRLKLRFGGDDRITLLRALPEPAVYMKACDVIISGANGLISTEAAVLGTALIQYLPSGSCERRNAEFFTRYGLSILVKRPGAGLVRALRNLEAEDVRKDMIKAQRFHISQLAAVELCSLAETSALSVRTESAGVLV